MNSKRLISTSSVSWIAIILAFILLYAAYFFIYIPGQETLVEKRGFRILKEYAGNMHDKCAYYQTHINNYSPYYIIDDLSRSELLISDQRAEIDRLTGNDKQVETLIDNLEKTIKTEHKEKDPLENDNSKLDEIKFENNYKELLFPAGDSSVVETVLSQLFAKTGSKDSVAVFDKAKKQIRKFEFKHKLPIETLMHDLKFDKLLNNIVLFSDSLALYNSNLEIIHDITYPKLLVDSIKKVQGGMLVKLNVRGQDNHVMVLPIDFYGSRLYLAGFISAPDFKKKTRAVNNQFLIIIAGILLLILIGMPILKIIFIGKNEQLHAGDATAATVSLIIGVGFFILIILSVMKHYVVDQHNLKSRIENISRTLYNNVDSDFKLVNTLYRNVIGRDTQDSDDLVKTTFGVFSNSLWQFSPTDPLPFQQGVIDSRDSMLYPLFQSLKISDTIHWKPSYKLEKLIEIFSIDTHKFSREKCKKALAKLQKFESGVFYLNSNLYQPFPVNYQKKWLPLNEVFLINENGEMFKAVSRTGASSLVKVNLSNRNYYRYMNDIKQGWYKKDSNEVTQNFYIESIKSYNSGKQEAAFSMKLPEAQAELFGAPIMVITSPLPSLYSQVLPEDLRFMLIDEKGDVLFHSNQSKNLHENFLTECDENDRLEGAIEHRVVDVIKVNYNEKSWLARIVPMKNAPLFHVTLIDLEFTQNKNARTLFYTFYFMIITFILILTGMQIMKLGKVKNLNTGSKAWFYTWLSYRSQNHLAYMFLLFIQSILLALQLIGILAIDKPVTMFIYQIIFIVFSAASALLIIGNVKKQGFITNFSKASFAMAIIYIIMAILLTLLLFLIENYLLLLPMFLLIPLAIMIYNYRKHANNEPSLKKGNIKLFLNVVSININNFPSLKIGSVNICSLSGQSTKKIFQLYMFIWLLCISAAPAIQYYHAVKVQEKALWKRDMLEYVAVKNLQLMQQYDSSVRGQKWYTQSMGNGIDYLGIGLKLHQPNSDEKSFLTDADKVYAQLPDPLTKGNSMMGLLKNSNFYMEWWRGDSDEIGSSKIKDDILHYSRAGHDGQIHVKQTRENNMEVLPWLLYFTIPIILVILILWFLYRFVSNIVLNTSYLDWVKPTLMDWKIVIQKNNINRILIKSLSGSFYRQVAEKQLKPDNQQTSLKHILASDLLELDIKSNISNLQKANLIWISDLDEFIKNPKTLEPIISKLKELNYAIQGKLVIELPFGMDYIIEYYDELVLESSRDQAEVAGLKAAILNLQNLFKDFYKYTGKIIPEPEEILLDQSLITKPDDITRNETELIAYQCVSELRYQYIWDNLSRFEKLVLHDLADDGMLNLKNKNLINQLKLKGLITFKPYPRVFCESFHFFLLNTIEPEETQEIEKHIGKQGKWRNMRYLILLILIPLIAFVFIAQGTSIEKVIGIVTGGLAVFSGLVRLFDNNAFRQSPDLS